MSRPITRLLRTLKATISHYRPTLLGADHQWRAGAEIDRGEHRGLMIIPTGVRYVDNTGQPSQIVSAAPVHTGGRFVTAAAFLSDAATLGDRVTINAGLRFAHSRAISQDVPRRDVDGRDTGETIRGLGTLYTWNVLSPRLGLTMKLTADGRTMLRASYGRFNQGILTGEVSPIHPGQSPTTTADFDPAAGGYTRNITVSDPTFDVQIDPDTRTPRTDAYSIGVDRELDHRLAVSIVYVRKDGRDFIGWTDIGGRYREGTRLLPDGRREPAVFQWQAVGCDGGGATPAEYSNSGFCSSRGARGGSRRKRCSICACRGRCALVAWAASRSSWICSMRSMAPRRKGWRRTICLRRISASPRCSLTRAARWSASG